MPDRNVWNYLYWSHLLLEEDGMLINLAYYENSLVPTGGRHILY